jgi:hypothetical protein
MPLRHATENYIQHVNKKVVGRPKPTIGGVLAAQDALAHQIFDLHLTADKIAPNLVESARMIEEFSLNYIA